MQGNRLYTVFMCSFLMCVVTSSAAQEVVGSVPIGGLIGQLSLNPTTNRVFVAGRYESPDNLSPLQVVDVSDPISPRIVFIPPGFPQHRGVVVNPLTNSVYSGVGVNVVRRDGTTLAPTGTVAAEGFCVTDFDLDPVTNRVYVASNAGACSQSGGTVLTVLNGATLAVLSPPNLFTNGVGKISVHVNSATGKSYLSTQLQTNVFSASYVRVGTMPSKTVIGVNPNSNHVFVRAATGIEILEGTGDTLLQTIPGAFGLGGVVDPVNNYAYVPDSAGLIAVVSGDNYSVRKFALGAGVRAYEPMAIDAANQRLYAIGSDSTGQQRLYVVDLAGSTCLVRLNQTTFVNGQTALLTLSLENRGAATRAIEFKLAIDGRRVEPAGLVNVGAAGDWRLPGLFDQTYGPFPLFAVTPASLRGDFEVACRLLHPVSGKLLSESVAPFTVQ
jgi:hypothetical protein